MLQSRKSKLINKARIRAHTRASTNPKLPRSQSPATSAQKRREFQTRAGQQFRELLKPDGWTFGLIATAVLGASATWAFVFHFRLQVPSVLWQWDHNVLAKGVEAVFHIFAWSVLCLILLDVLHVRRNIVTRQVADHVWTTYLLGLFTLPVLYCGLEEFEGVLLAFALTLSAAPLLALTDVVRMKACPMVPGSILHNLRRLRRRRLIAAKVHIETQMTRPFSVNVFGFAPIYLIVFSAMFHGFMLGFAETWLPKHRILLAEGKNKIALFRSGDYWVVKSAIRVDDTLLLEPTTHLLKIEDPIASKIRISTGKYRLKPLDGLLKDLGPLAPLVIAARRTDVE
jgi:hypothetical protein